MNTQAAQNEHLQYVLTNAFDLLEDVKDKMGMFQTQRYHRLKGELAVLSKQLAADGNEWAVLSLQ